MSDVSGLYSQQAAANQQMREYRAMQDRLDGKIQRLKDTKNKIASKKDAVSSQRGVVAGMMFAERFKGQNYTQYQGRVRDGLTQGYNNYYNEVDRIQDDLNLEISRLQNECNDVMGWMGNVRSWLNDLGMAIRNAYN